MTQQRGWITSDILSKTAVTTFYVTVESLSGAAVGVGMAQLADNQGCSASSYNYTGWMGSSGATCAGDFLTFYTSRPSGTTSAITATMTVGHTYRFEVTPNAATAVTSRCGQVDITGIANPYFIISLIHS